MTAFCRMTNERVKMPCSYAGCPLFGDCLVAYEKATVKPKTNADHIRSMTDEELAEFMFLMLDCVSCQNKLMRGKCNEEYFAMCKGDGRKCKEICLNWLRQPYKEDADD